MESTRKKIRDFQQKHGLRHDWHEPDGIKAKVVGNHLDNACGDAGTCGEKVIVIKSDDGDSIQVNLATVLALAANPDLEL